MCKEDQYVWGVEQVIPSPSNEPYRPKIRKIVAMFRTPEAAQEMIDEMHSREGLKGYLEIVGPWPLFK